jgi:SAM-dependent methyltransferase
MDDALSNLDELLALPFQHLNLQSISGDMHVRVTRKGRVLVSKGKASIQRGKLKLAHDRIKDRPLPVNESNEFLRAIGVSDKSGKVRPGMRAKFRQINEFIRLIEEVMPQRELEGQPMDIVDCGCGNAYLTFAAYHYINHIKGMSARVAGIDSNAEIIEKCRSLSNSLGWDGLEFHTSQIVDFEPATPPGVVLSLHACDTATDEAIAQGIIWNSNVIVAAPCCQHELHDRIQAPAFQPILRHGILKQRTADILTDAFRALVLRIMGYRTDVVQFVSPEHTSKNLMIRAVKGLPPGDGTHVREYEELKKFWSVSPIIEELLGERFRRYL